MNRLLSLLSPIYLSLAIAAGCSCVQTPQHTSVGRPDMPFLSRTKDVADHNAAIARQARHPLSEGTVVEPNLFGGGWIVTSTSGGILHGPYFCVSRRGVVRVAGQFVHGLQEGPWWYCHEGGRFAGLAEYSGGELRGCLVRVSADGRVLRASRVLGPHEEVVAFEDGVYVREVRQRSVGWGR